MRTEAELEALEDRAYEEQAAHIREVCGDKAADNANYGWGVGGDDDHTSIATKVYGDPGGVLVSTIDHETGTIEHNWEV